MTVTCYPQPGKSRSADILRRFAAGARGKISSNSGVLEPGPAAFFGVVGITHLLGQARADGRDWFYGDNSYFDATRMVMTRFGKNALQDSGGGAPAWDRFKATGIKVQPWKTSGRSIIVCQQSDHYMEKVACWPGGGPAWLDGVLSALKANTDRPIIVRPHDPSKMPSGATFRVALADAWALVAHASAAANEAILAGVPAFVTGACAASRMASDDLRLIESPVRPDGREEWAAALAGQQWTLSEIENGTAWRALCEKAG